MLFRTARVQRAHEARESAQSGPATRCGKANGDADRENLR
jgi:hypothetical protein